MLTTIITAAATFIFGTGGTLLLTSILNRRREMAEVAKTGAESGLTSTQGSMLLIETLMGRTSDLEKRVAELEKDRNDKALEIIRLEREKMELEITLHKAVTGKKES